MTKRFSQKSDQELGRAIDAVLDAMRDAGVETVGDGVEVLFGAMIRVLALPPPPMRQVMTQSVVAALPGAVVAMASQIEKHRALRDAAPQGRS